MILRHVCRCQSLFRLQAWSLPSGYIPSVLALAGFLGGCWWKRVDNKSLPNFFISSFVSPMLRFWCRCSTAPSRGTAKLMIPALFVTCRFPKSVPAYIKEWTWANTWGDVAVYVMLILGLITTWLFQGIDHLFVGFLFLQAVPEVQKHFWFRPTVLLTKTYPTTYSGLTSPISGSYDLHRRCHGLLGALCVHRYHGVVLSHGESTNADDTLALFCVLIDTAFLVDSTWKCSHPATSSGSFGSPTRLPTSPITISSLASKRVRMDLFAL